MKKNILTLILFLIPILLSAQFSMPRQSTVYQPADSLDIKYYSKKNGWAAAGEFFGLNMVVWAFDRYIQKADFAVIGINSMKTNLKKGFIWDNDKLGTNMFLHPYHGNLYFNSARSRGFNYWESGVFAVGGSAMWELFMESEYPSTNDIIATPLGGMALGELFYRASDLALDDRTSGGERFKHEAIAFLLAPTRGLTRIITGDAWRVRSTTGRQFGTPMISIEVATGIRILELEDEIFDKGVGGVVHLNIEYGDRYHHDTPKPYDYFMIRSQFNLQASQPALGQINLTGRLWGAELIDTSKDFLGIGAYQHFDYYDSDTISSQSNVIPYKLATPAAFGIGLIHQSKRFANWDFNSYAHLNAIILGGSLSDHYRVSDRNYNIGSGLGWKAGVNISYKDKIGASWIYEGYRLFTLKGYPEGTDLNTVDYSTLDAQGDKSNATLNTSSIKVDLKLREQLYLTGIGTFHRRTTHYKYFEDIRSITAEGQLMLSYKF